jgi:lipopolysaccharide cholinephosphotransferase
MEDFSHYNGEGTKLRKVQLRLVDMLIEIDKICRRHNIQYWLDCGTLLGAVRHGGFIPWDDDLDIAMPTEDLSRFIEIAPKELPKNLFLQNRSSDPNYYCSFNKIRDNNSLCITPGTDFSKEYNKGLFIDIFEVLPYPNVSPHLQKTIMRWYKKIDLFMHNKQEVTLKNHLAAISFPFINLGLNCLWGILNLGKKNKLGYEKHFSFYGNSYTKDMVFPLKDISFEGHTFLGPANPDCYLTCIYGDYMEIPPKEKRRIHNVYFEFY